MTGRSLSLGLAALLACAPTNASPAGAEKLRSVPRPGAITPVVTPAFLRSQPANFMIEVSGDPVAVVEADAERKMNQAERTAHKGRLRTTQIPIESRIRSLGGRMLGNYQSAYNGIKVRIAASRVEALKGIPNVIAVHRLVPMMPNNAKGVPAIGAPTVWGGVPGFLGDGIKIAIIDTGIDYTHADFGGPGTQAAFLQASAASTQPADPSLFGPNAPKVKGGIDLVGDDYDPASGSDPVPDPNPLDCNSHGTHVAGTAAGFGVLASGSTYQGPYNAGTVSGNSWKVGPGVAPKADLYAIRVFGCSGGTDVVIDAIDWAVANDMDVINLSLGSEFGEKDSPDAVAVSNAAKAGVIVVVAAGNAGPIPYIVGSPGSSTRAITVAAMDPIESFPRANVALPGGVTLSASNSNAASFSNGLTPPVKVLMSGGDISLGCDASDYVGVTGKLVVTRRGGCARVLRAIYGQQAGAAAVLMVNSADELPPFEGPISSDPNTGLPYEVTIPFLGAASSAAAALLASDGANATLSNATPAPNPGFAVADFSSGGPRAGDSWLKPDVKAPGVSIVSAAIGSGTEGVAFSGTSMATPHTAGLAVLALQAHPSWKKVALLKAAIANTADPGPAYSTRLTGAGLIQAPAATSTQVVALGDPGTATLNFGFAELASDYARAKTITLHNLGRTDAFFGVSSVLDQGSPHGVSFSAQSINVPARGVATLEVTLSVPAATAGTSATFADVAGQVLLTPAPGSNSDIALRVPYYFVPQALSDIKVTLNKPPKALSGLATITNDSGVVPGAADFYAWGISDPRDPALDGAADLRAAGVQRLTLPGGESALVFALSTHQRWSTASSRFFEVYVDVDGDALPDYDVIGYDYGLLTSGNFSGEMASAVFSLTTGQITIQFFAYAPTDSSTILLPVSVAQLCESGSPCLSATNPRFTYQAAAGDLIGGSYNLGAEIASFNAFTPSLSTGMYAVVAPGGTATSAVNVNSAEWALTPAHGLMVVSQDNRSGPREAQLVPVRVR